MSFYNLPPPYNPGFALPQYVQAEPPARGTYTTKWLPRGTISEVVPDYLAQPSKNLVSINSSLSGTVFDSGTLHRHSLQGDTLGARKGGCPTKKCHRRGARVFQLEGLGDDGADPVAEYGRRTASWIMTSIKRVPEEHRKAALRALLDAVDPKLWPKVEQLGTAYSGQGMSPQFALERALSEEMTKGLAKEIIDVGRRVMRGEPGPVRKQSQLGLGLYPDACFEAHCRGLEALGWNPVSAVKKAASKVGSAVVSAGKSVVSAGKQVVRTVGAGASAIASGTKNLAGEVWDGTKWVAGKVGSGVEQAAEWVGDAVEKLGDLACSLANSSVGQIAAGAGAAAAGAPPAAGAAGAQAVSAMCSSPAAAAPAAAAATAPSGLPGWLLPVGAAAAGGAVLYMTLRKKR